jgi:diguanylate cyclase (GGDEF)-like protein
MQRGQKRYLHQLINDLPAPTILVEDGVIVACNAPAADVLGVGHGQAVITQRVDAVIAGIQDAAPIDERMEITIRRSDESIKHVIISCTALAGSRSRQMIVGLEDVTELRRAITETQRLAAYDQLTDLPNRRFTLEILQQTIARNHRSSRPTSVLFLDLDGFKIINDTLGHETGDNLLREIGRTFRGAIRSGEQIGRLGGDEFVLIIDGDVATAQLAAQRVLNALREPIKIGTARSAHINASIGVASDEHHSLTASELLSAADHAMYQAKRAGRGQAVVAAAELVVTKI